MKKSFTCDSFLDFKFINDPQLSPNGAFTAFFVKKSDIKSNSYQNTFYLLDNKSGGIRQMTSAKSVASYCWEDEKSILFPTASGYSILDTDSDTIREEVSLPLRADRILPAGKDVYALTSSFDLDAPCQEGLTKEEYEKQLNAYRNRGYEHIREIPFTLNGAGFVNRKRKRVCLFNSRTGQLDVLTEPLFHTAGMKVSAGKILYVGQTFTDIKSLKNGAYIYDIEKKRHACLLEPERFLVKSFDIYQNQVILNLTDGASYGNG